MEMAGELVNIADQYKGLPMDSLIGGPLTAACDAQVMLAKSCANFITTIGFEDAEHKTIRQAKFSFMRPKDGEVEAGKQREHERVDIEVPLLSIVRVPSLMIKTLDITFDMEVKSSFSEVDKSSKSGSLEASAQIGFGPFSASVKIQGSISASRERTRTSDNSAKYHVSVHAADEGMPEGLARVLDIMQSSIAPKAPPAA